MSHKNMFLSCVRKGLVFGVALCVFAPLSASAGVEINPYPQKAMPFSAKQVEDSSVVAPDEDQAMDKADSQDASIPVYVPDVVVEQPELPPQYVQDTSDVDAMDMAEYGEDTASIDDLSQRERRFTASKPQSRYEDIRNLPEPLYGRADVDVAADVDVPGEAPLPLVAPDVLDVPDISAEHAANLDVSAGDNLPVRDIKTPIATPRTISEAFMKSERPSVILKSNAAEQNIRIDDIVRSASAPQAEEMPTEGLPVVLQPPKWHALEGANVKETLDVWSEQAGVDFVWNGSHIGFHVLHTAQFIMGYEDAVRYLLDQYKTSLVRPVGRLYVSPNYERRVLVVDVNNGV